METRVLVAYASKAGSTAEIAAKIRETIARRNVAVDLLPVSKVSDLSPYQAVVIGSAIRMGNVLPEVKTFIEQNKAVLAQKPFSLFIGCMTLKDDTEVTRKEVSAYLDPLRAVVKPASEGLFAGVIDLKKLPVFERLLAKMIKAPEGDFRDWAQINAWAENVPVG